MNAHRTADRKEEHLEFQDAEEIVVDRSRASPEHHRRAGAAAVSRIAAAGPTSEGLTRQALADQLRRASEAVDDGLTAVLHRLYVSGLHDAPPEAGQIAGAKIFGWIRNRLVAALGAAADVALGGAISKVGEVAAVLEAEVRAGRERAERSAIEGIMHAVKGAARRQISALASAVGQAPDEALYGLLDALDPTRPLFTAEDVAVYAFTVFEAVVRPHLPVREQVERIQALPGNLRGLAEDVAAVAPEGKAQ